jgi:hypothetical protein
MKRNCIVSFALLFAVLACGSPPAVLPSPTAIRSINTPGADLWYQTFGGPKSDQAWGVAVDPAGNIYLGAFEQKTGQWFTDMAIYKFAPDGTQVWRTEWGGQYQEKVFIAAVEGSVLYVGGLTHTGMGLTEADMAVLALDLNTGALLWNFTWGQGYGYEEVDGLVVDSDSIYISGWSTSEGGNYDIAILKLDRQGNKIWESVWGTAGFDSCDGQMVVTADGIFVSGKLNADNMLIGGQAYVARFSKDTGEYQQHYVYPGHVTSDGLGMVNNGQTIYVVGMDFIAGEGNQLLVLKLDHALNLLWDRHWGDDGGEYVSRTGAVNEAGELVVAVTQRVPNSAPADIVLVFYNPEGVLLRTTSWGGPDEEIAHGMVNQDRFLYLAGEIKYAAEPQNDILIIKADAVTGEFPSP